jgi:predicted  nucleic acid-binding Zn-ribbon protein
MLATLGIYLGELKRIIENLKHSSGGFNQHFAPLQNSMEKIEQQINLLSTQIEAMSSDIKTVESILEKDFKDWSQQEKRKYGNEEDEARKQLRSEKEQLRRKEEQLRRKEEQLRRKEEQLRELLIEKERQRTQGIIMKEG